MNNDDDLLDQISNYYKKYEPFCKEYGISKLRLSRIVRKPGRHPIEFRRLIIAFFQDLDTYHNKIQEIKTTGLGSIPGYWERLTSTFTDKMDRESFPEIEKVKSLVKNIQALVSGFLKNHRDKYARQVKQITPQQTDQ